MKKLTSLLLALLILSSQLAFAEDTPEIFTSGDYEYTLSEDKTAVITNYFGSDSELIIPDTLDGHAVTGIGENAFNFKEMTTVTIPEGVTDIGIHSFSGCEFLTEVTVPETVKTIGISAFSGCVKLKEFTIPEGVTRIEIAAFADCHKLTKITIPDSVTSIGDSAFASCRKLKDVTIPDGVTEIGTYAFPSTAIMKIVIPDSVTYIGEGAFSWCFSLYSVTLPASIPGLDLNTMFEETMNITSFKVPTGSDSAAICEKAGVKYTCYD